MEKLVLSEILRFSKKLYVFAPEPVKPVHVRLNCPVKAETQTECRVDNLG